MQLWNDYEGKTIADIYTLGKLLRPEGRSALFTIAGDSESPAIIRLTESLNDEGQMLACWKRVSSIKQENLLAIRAFGETSLAGTPLTYAVMEPTDANLGELLAERAMTQTEAMQVATSLTAALSALHANDLVHEHIAPINVLAVGETVKLRTDCVRVSVVDEITTAEDCKALVERDVHDLATLLLRALTLEKKLSPTTRLPAPFDRIIPNAMNGSWGLAEITTALTPAAARMPIGMPPAAARIPNALPVSKLPIAAPAIHAVPASPASSAALDREPTVAANPSSAPADSPLLYQRRVVTPIAPEARRVPMPVWAAAGLAAVGAIAVSLHSGKPAEKVQIVPAPSLTQPAVSRPISQPLPKETATVAPLPPATAPQRSAASGDVASVNRLQPGWYVIAYTFNHEEQARKRAAAIVKHYGWLHPEVIAPGSGSAYLVALGGPMSRDQAESTRNRARQVGMPRDTFVRNYKPS